jgi:peptide-methionine (S)-S-oxide reductase
MNASAESKDNRPANTQLATLGGGCFWCLDAVFRPLPGVKSLTCGYAGGKTDNPTYEQVCSKTTGHAEVVQIEFDPAQVGYEKLLELYWKAHDPTTLNRQGADVGTQYRSAIFYHNEAQKLAAEKSKQEVQKRFSSPIVTEITPLTKFWPAEDYHQDYFRKNPTAGYCRFVIKPKLDKLKAH